jgi:uncharacterized protein (DUF927 family)
MIDFKQIAAVAAEQAESVCARWLPAGKRSGSEWEVGSRHGEEGKSLKIHLAGTKAGTWADFAAGDAGGDMIALIAYIENIPQLAAARRLADFLGIRVDSGPSKPKPAPAPNPAPKSAAWAAIMPIPADAPPAPLSHYRHGTPDNIYTYRDQAGQVLGYVARWDASAARPKKEFGWLVYAQNNGRTEWRWQGFPAPRPLYGLELLAAQPAAPVCLAEGEKAADAARALLPDYICMTWPGGGKAVGKADFRPLKGREVLVWADADAPGAQAMAAAAELAIQAGARPVSSLSLTALATELGVEQLPAGYDAADLLGQGWNATRMAEFLSRAGAVTATPAEKPTKPQPKPARAAPQPAASNCHLSDAGLYWIEPGRDGEGDRLTRISDKIEVTALGRDAEGGAWSPVVTFADMDGTPRTEIIPRRLFLGDGQDGVKLLCDAGLYIEPGRAALDRLKAYIASARPPRRARLTESLGWHGQAFAFPHETLGGTAGESLIYRGSRRAAGVFTMQGSLAEWQAAVAKPAIGNFRLAFSLCAAFAGSILYHLGAQSFALHWHGDSSSGKSALLNAAASAWGPPRGMVHSWRATDNALEGIAAQHNDSFLPLDEFKELSPQAAGAAVYMLSNGKPKTRMHHAGGLREAQGWRITMMSSGELGLADHLASVGQKTHAGQEVRFIELPIDAGAGYGAWNHLAGHADGAALTDTLKAAAAQYHGTAGRAFVQMIIDQPHAIAQVHREVERTFVDYCFVPAGAGGQVRRVAASFAIVATAGELAIRWGILPWEPGDAIDAAGLLFKHWIASRPTVGNSEEYAILAHVRGLMESGWQSRFLDWHRMTTESDLSRATALINPLGFRRNLAKPTYSDPDDPKMHLEQTPPDFRFYVTRSRFADEFATKAGHKPRRVAALLKGLGILDADSDSSTKKETLPNGDPRSYCIIGSALWKKTEYLFGSTDGAQRPSASI